MCLNTKITHENPNILDLREFILVTYLKHYRSKFMLLYSSNALFDNTLLIVDC